MGGVAAEAHGRTEIIDPQPSERWHREVPGARWFRADLHIRTLDDYPGNRISWGDRAAAPMDAETIDRYARRLLETAIARGVEVLGLTPHAVYCDGNEALSAVWRIVETWATADDDRGRPYRDSIYSVFPGFEPSLADGARGVHLQFLFDPTIGREGLVRVFHAVMDGVEPWRDGSLVNAGRSAKDVLPAVASRAAGEAWNWLCLAPHAFAAQQGLFGQLKSQMLQQFRHEYISGLELGDSQMPEDPHEGRDWLADGMKKYHHAFHHASDAYRLSTDAEIKETEIGWRTTMIKMAEPTIEALRQAFLAADSRVRLSLVRPGERGTALAPAPQVEAVPLRRPWLRTIKVTGGTSFFGGRSNGNPRSTTIRLNPDLTCVIGGRMSGKSTLLDGMRVAFDFPLPLDVQVANDVRGRGVGRFLSGTPEVEIDICGPIAPTEATNERWPAIFYTQRELQQAASDQAGLRDLLFQMGRGRTEELRRQFSDIRTLSAQLRALVPQLTRVLGDIGEAEQALASADAARAGVERHEKVGAQRLTTAQADTGRLRAASTEFATAENSITAARSDLERASVPDLTTEAVQAALPAASKEAVQSYLNSARLHAAEAITSVAAGRTLLEDATRLGQERTNALRAEIEQALVVEGGTAEELNEFMALSTTAQEYEERRLHAETLRARLLEVRTGLEALRSSLLNAQVQHRALMREVTEAISIQFNERIRVQTVQDGIRDELEAWVLSLRERGVTRWWNDLTRVISPSELLSAIDTRDLASVGMSDQVAETFLTEMSETRRWELAGTNTPDRYVLQLLVAPGEFRDMAQLSGGQQVSLLLSLLLETDDDRPLVIDQPEEELDKAYLFDVVLPALRRLKGLRQIIFVTHDANIVVNGDADQVVYLQADSDSGWVAAEGAIEQQPVRDAILTVLDGGEQAFELRSRKYGF